MPAKTTRNSATMRGYLIPLICEAFRFNERDIMAQFASIWAIKTSSQHNPGDTITVSLKSGGTTEVTVAQYLYSSERKDGSKAFYHLAAKQDA